jgi:hypothetical protein
MKNLILGLAAVAALGAALPAAAQTGDWRAHRQEQRIEQGLRHGQLTPREAIRLERQHRKLDRSSIASVATAASTVSSAPASPGSSSATAARSSG